MKELFNSISRHEWRFVIIMAVVMIIITGLPYLYAIFVTPDGLIYNGLGSLTPADNHVYYSYINQVKAGNIFIKDLFTSESQELGMIALPWIIIGTVARIFHLSPAVAFHLSRLILIPIFLAVIYLFISLFFNEHFKRKLSLVFVLFSAGLGAYLIGPLSLFDFSNKPGYWTPNDIWIPESITFLTLYKTPHFIASITLTVLIFLLMFLAFKNRRLSYSIIAGFLALVYFSYHPFYAPIIFGVLGLYLFALIFKAKKILWPLVGYYLIFILVSIPSILYHAWILLESPVLQQRGFQNVTLAPPFIFILLGYGFLWLGAILGITWLIKQKKLSNHFLLLLIWLVFSVLMVNLPFQLQSRYTQGIHIPLVIFTIVGLFGFKDFILTKKNQQRYNILIDNKFLLAIIFFFAFCFSNLFNVVRDVYYFTSQPGQIINYFYISQEKFSAMETLSGPIAQNTVLANLDNSLFIPWVSGQSVFIAHSIETLDFHSKLSYLQWFFTSDKHADKKRRFLRDNNIDYLFLNKLDKKSGYFDPASKDYLTLIYQNSEVEIYQVTK